MSLLDTASLIVTPNAYKEGKLYSVIPSDGSGDLSVTRATTATRVNSAGLVELVPYNIYEYSERFDNAYWTKAAVTISANATTSPNGTLTAEKAIGTAATTAHDVARNLTRPSGSYTATMSIYAKKSEDKYILLLLADGSGGIGITFDVDLGTVSTAAVTYGVGWSAVSNSITSVGNDWFRITFTATTTNASTSLNTSYRVGNIPDLFGGSTGNGVNGVFIWGAQLVEGTQAKDYFATETRLNIPRIDYSLGGCPSILVEPQRTNVLFYSEEFNNAYWGKQSGATVVSNTAISPSGIQNADTINLVSGSTISRVERASISISANTYYTVSIYLKNISLTSGQTFQIRLETSGFDLRGTVDLFNKTNTVSITGTTGTGYVSGTQSASITELSNGWLRCNITVQAGSSVVGTGTFYLITDVDANRSFYVWGAQLEAGAYPTSYIPTTSASVTRNADVISKTGISSLIGQSEGAIFYEFSVPIVENVTRVISISDASGSNRLNISTYSNSIFVRVDVGGAVQVSSSAAISVTNMNKIAFRYKANDFSLYVNGVNVITDTSGITFPAATLDRISNLQPDLTFPFNGNIKAIALWKTGLTNAQLSTLTTI